MPHRDVRYLRFLFFQAEYGIRDAISDWSSDMCSSDLISPSRVAYCMPSDFRAISTGGALRLLSPGRIGTATMRQATNPTSAATPMDTKIGRASWRERVWQYV